MGDILLENLDIFFLEICLMLTHVGYPFMPEVTDPSFTLTLDPPSPASCCSEGVRGPVTCGGSDQSGLERDSPSLLRRFGSGSQPACPNGPVSKPGTDGTDRRKFDH